MDRQPPANSSSNAPKRSHESRVFYPRKRALVACQVCRRKKTKCNNVRPTCGSCQELKIECHYSDSKFDNSTYDPASIEILEQIGHVTRLLEAQNAYLLGMAPNLLHAKHVFSPPPSNDLTNDDASPPFTFAIATIQDPNDGNHHYEPRDEAVLLSESLEFAETAVGKCEDVLEWLIFEGKFHRSETETLIFNPELAREDQPGSILSVNCDPDRRSTPSRGI
ncbi:hypothetical protein K469DRAFT_687506 [Zopfia rhizophila CBS 207.26]|uniref:Zn(2)-C6 fungal-type domain-containing protein n=1 Tax=Zopfia rhizophila CBS 207.26 TaxID=1314779 RepID=A0A6A6E4L0_9PEZI|nr:hypothetical protein K469DRAFT_687506 [Zopfia rhizophila CBS 207.26]